MTMIEEILSRKEKKWIYKILKENGNCYVSELVDLKELEEATGLKLKIRLADCGGYVIEVIKNEK